MFQIEKEEIVKNEDALNGDFIYKLAGFQFDAAQLLKDYQFLIEKHGVPKQKQGQLNCHVRSDAVKSGMSYADLFSDFCGSLAKEKNHTRTVAESEFDTIHPALEGMYIAEVIQKVLDYSYQRVGRVRLLNLDPKSCYSMHKDPDWYRLHIPIKTSPKNFFIVDEKYYTMPDVGGLYVIHPQPLHTAVNSELFENRLHLVFDTAEEMLFY